MREYLPLAFIAILMTGTIVVPNLSQATDESSNKDRDGRHRLLSVELRSKVEHLRSKLVEHREDHYSNPNSPEALQAEVTRLKTDLSTVVNNEATLLSQLNAVNAWLSSLAARLSTLETSGGGGGGASPALSELVKYVRVDPGTLNGLKGPHVIFHDANVHVQSGSGTTDEAAAPTGLGNLIVGYDEMPFSAGWSRVGSHNLVVGPSHAFSSTGGVVFGRGNSISGQYATILGGIQNSSEALASSILGGFGKFAISPQATSPETTYP